MDHVRPVDSASTLELDAADPAGAADSAGAAGAAGAADSAGTAGTEGAADVAPAAARLDLLAELVGGLAVELQDDAGGRLPLIARDVFARLARLVGASRVVLWRTDRGHDDLRPVHEWQQRAGPARPTAPGVAAAPGAPVERGEPGAPERLPWSAAELAAVDVLSWGTGNRTEAEPGRTSEDAEDAAVAVPLLADGSLDAVLSLQWAGPATGWSADLVPLVRVVGTLLRGSERLVELAERPALDEATGLANRKLLLLTLGRSLAQLERRSTSGVAVVACQVGSAADARASLELVRTVGRRLDRQTREGDLVAIFDGRTLVVVCDDVAGPDEALAITHRLRAALSDDIEPGAGAAVPRAAFGVAHASQRMPPGVVLRQADAAAYLAAASDDRVRLAGD